MDSLFPPENFSLIAVILGFPLLGAIVNGLWGRQLGKPAVRAMALTAIGVSFAASLLTFLSLAHHVEQEKGEHVKLVWNVWEWMHTTGGRGTDVPIAVKFSVDALSGVMMLVITGVGFLIHLYATSYMEKDPGFWRFFSYLNLFVFAMLVLVLGDNLPVLFIGWEGVGLCSYLLIGFWYESMPNAAAGKKAFIANRIGDFGLICAMFLLVQYTGALDWTGIANGSTSLVTPPGGAGDMLRIHLWPIGGGEFRGFLHFLQPTHPLTISAATAVGLALFLGCTGKSAQIPLYVWLPDAMAGPTPVSALIHAATMVTAGVYLVCRLSFVFVLSPFTMTVIACTGAATALFAATIALVQNDIKKVLAYSTVSQLGFMFMGVGVGAFTAGFFHVFTHAFFKACLFLGAGSVIHAMHARIHDDVKSQDMRFMGGLRKYMPLTYWTFLASTLAIAGMPLTSGFFSKDEILGRAFVSHSVNPFSGKPIAHNMQLWTPPTWIGPAVYWVGVTAATLTAFYMFRAVFLTFWGDFRGWTIGRPSVVSHHEAHGHDEKGHDDHGHHEEDLTTPGYAPHESPWQMTVPLIILGTFAIFAGFLNAPIFKIGGHPWEPMGKWLEPVFEDALKGSVVLRENADKLEWPLACGGIAAFLIGTGISYWMYIARAGAPARALAERAPGLHRLVLDKWRIDELYEWTVLGMVDALADTFAAFDQTVVDGILARLSALIIAGLGALLRTFQNGVVHVYSAFMVLGLAAMGWFFVAPHPSATVTASGDGDYVIDASPGMGYSYRWDANGDGKPDDATFGTKQQVKIHLDANATQHVGLEVQNAFGLSAQKEITIVRPGATQTLEIGQR
ncbi:MAG TPA: NADH-quinone oxidoreductase subunit L [Polyangiaceae bacterium]|jgi:NADH-quinone oxidoreductase subunit L